MPSHPPHADPGTPDTKSPNRFLWWVLRRQAGRAVLGGWWGTLAAVGMGVMPYLIGQAIDEGLGSRDTAVLGAWTLGIVALGASNAVTTILRHRTMSKIRADAALRTIQIVNRHAAKLGSVLPNKVSAGEVVTIGTNDTMQIGHALTSAGPGVGSVIACIVIAVLVLSVSPLLGVLVLVGVPGIVLLVGPLMSRLQRTETVYRDRQGKLTSRAGDIVAGLRVLRGIGGENLFADRYRDRSTRLRAEGYRVGAVSSWIHALARGLPGLFLALVTWLAARQVAAEQVTVGDMVAVYGYAAALVVPVAVFIEGIFGITRGRVAAARAIAILRLRPDVYDTSDPVAGPPDGPADLHDRESGLRVTAGDMVAVATRDAEAAADLVDRLARYRDSDTTYGGVALSAMALDEVRRRIVVTDNDSYLFAGTLREQVSPNSTVDDDTIMRAVSLTAADDIVDGLPEGLDTPVGTQALTLSGGQRQRVRLVRALLAEPETLIAPEPTSAVDAHTEAAVVDGLRRHRHGRTTLVLSSSPLVLDRCDTVAYLDDGKVVATGTHSKLLAGEPGYRALVLRGAEQEAGS